METQNVPFILKWSLISLVVLCFAMFISGFYTLYNSFSLMSCLKKTKYQRWVEITSIGKIGPGLNNPFRAAPYIRSNLDNEDERIAQYKGAVQVGTRYFILNFLAALINLGFVYFIIDR
jgi:hypothetical protein